MTSRGISTEKQVTTARNTLRPIQTSAPVTTTRISTMSTVPSTIPSTSHETSTKTTESPTSFVELTPTVSHDVVQTTTTSELFESSTVSTNYITTTQQLEDVTVSTNEMATSFEDTTDITDLTSSSTELFSTETISLESSTIIDMHTSTIQTELETTSVDTLKEDTSSVANDLTTISDTTMESDFSQTTISVELDTLSDSSTEIPLTSTLYDYSTDISDRSTVFEETTNDMDTSTSSTVHDESTSETIELQSSTASDYSTETIRLTTNVPTTKSTVLSTRRPFQQTTGKMSLLSTASLRNLSSQITTQSMSSLTSIKPGRTRLTGTSRNTYQSTMARRYFTTAVTPSMTTGRTSKF